MATGFDSGRLRALALVPDLMDRSRIEPIAASAGARLVVVTTVDEIRSMSGQPWDLVLVDLDAPDALSVLAGLPGARTVGFGSHVDRNRLAAARGAGCSEVVSRSALFRRLRALLEQGSGPPAG